MPVIKVWCLPKLTESYLKDLFMGIVDAAKSIPELGLKDEHSMTVLFPTDAMKYGLGEEIIVEAAILMKPERDEEVRQRLAQALGRRVKGFFPKANVQCFVFPFEPAQGSWTSPPQEEPKTRPMEGFTP